MGHFAGVFLKKSAGAEAVGWFIDWRVGAVDPADLGMGGTLVQPALEMLKRFFIAAGQYLDPTIIEVDGVAGEPE